MLGWTQRKMQICRIHFEKRENLFFIFDCPKHHLLINCNLVKFYCVSKKFTPFHPTIEIVGFPGRAS